MRIGHGAWERPLSVAKGVRRTAYGKGNALGLRLEVGGGPPAISVRFDRKPNPL